MARRHDRRSPSFWEQRKRLRRKGRRRPALFFGRNDRFTSKPAQIIRVVADSLKGVRRYFDSRSRGDTSVPGRS
jgi:hypothetical protein